MTEKITQSKSLRGTVTVPGDKSISHRALMFGALADGPCEISGLSLAADPKSTKDCLLALGVKIVEKDVVVIVHGAGLHGLRAARGTLQAGNSGTTMRLLAGILAGQNFASEITGDDSLCRRPMQRIIEPLSSMGADIQGTKKHTAPLKIKPVPRLRSITYDMPVASAQVKSAILLAGLYAEGTTRVTETIPTRDHTERMLGLSVSEHSGKRVIEVEGGMKIPNRAFTVPGDISAASFFISAGMLIPESEITIKNVGLNPTRTAVLDVYRQIGGKFATHNRRTVGGEAVGDITVSSSELRTGFELRGERVAALIDEIPALAVTAAFSGGVFAVRDARELRGKESDRIQTLVANLRALGLQVEEYDDGFAFEGAESLQGGRFDSHNDHRIAMALAVAGLRARGESEIVNSECVDISFPGFWKELRRLQKAT